MKKYLPILRNCPLFYGIDDNDILAMLPCLEAKVEVFDKKYTVLREGSRPDYIGVVLSGAVQVSSLDYYGNRSIIAVMKSKEAFGEAFACADISELPISVIASELSEIMLLRARKIITTCSHHCSHHNALIYNLMKSLAEKSLMFNKRIEITSKRTTRAKLLEYLHQYAKSTGRQSFTIPLDRQALADYLEVDRSGLSAELSKLRREGVLTSHKNKFTLLK